MDTARLASLVNVSEWAVGMGADKLYVKRETEKSIGKYMAAVGSFLRPDLQPSRKLQNLLTKPLHDLAIDWLWRNADEPTRQRPNSLMTPHATDWLSKSIINLQTQSDFLASIKWCTGIKFRDTEYPCRGC